MATVLCCVWGQRMHSTPEVTETRVGVGECSYGKRYHMKMDPLLPCVQPWESLMVPTVVDDSVTEVGKFMLFCLHDKHHSRYSLLRLSWSVLFIPGTSKSPCFPLFCVFFLFFSLLPLVNNALMLFLHKQSHWQQAISQ